MGTISASCKRVAYGFYQLVVAGILGTLLGVCARTLYADASIITTFLYHSTLLQLQIQGVNTNVTQLLNDQARYRHLAAGAQSIRPCAALQQHAEGCGASLNVLASHLLDFAETRSDIIVYGQSLLAYGTALDTSFDIWADTSRNTTFAEIKDILPGLRDSTGLYMNAVRNFKEYQVQRDQKMIAQWAYAGMLEACSATAGAVSMLNDEAQELGLTTRASSRRVGLSSLMWRLLGAEDVEAIRID